MENPNDVKELIPEFFYLPEFLVNENGRKRICLGFIVESDIKHHNPNPNPYSHKSFEYEYCTLTIKRSYSINTVLWLEKFWSMSIKHVTPFSDVLSIPLGQKEKICVFTVTRPTLIFASDPMNFYTEFG